MADIILPETTYLERLDPLRAPGSPRQYVGIRQPVVTPQLESRTILDIIKGLAKALDAKREFETPLSQVFNFTIEEFIDAQLKGLPIDRETLMQEASGWVLSRKKPTAHSVAVRGSSRPPPERSSLFPSASVAINFPYYQCMNRPKRLADSSAWFLAAMPGSPTNAAMPTTSGCTNSTPRMRPGYTQI